MGVWLWCTRMRAACGLHVVVLLVVLVLHSWRLSEEQGGPPPAWKRDPGPPHESEEAPSAPSSLAAAWIALFTVLARSRAPCGGNTLPACARMLSSRSIVSLHMGTLKQRGAIG
jgi:hypothetical protein